MTADIRPTPQTPNSERMVLGAAIMSPSVVEMATSMGITADMFFPEKNQTLWRMLCERAAKGEPIDTWAMVQHLDSTQAADAVGGLAYVSSLGDKAPTPEGARYHIRDMISHHQRREIIRVCKETQDEAHSGRKDPGDITTTAENKLQDVAQSDSDLLWLAPRAAADEAYREAERNMDLYRSGREVGIPLPLPSLAQELTLSRGNFCIVGARPGMGKTALGMQMADHVAAEGGSALVVELEMTRSALLWRLACGDAGIPMRAVLSGDLTDRQWSDFTLALSDRQDCGLRIIDRPGLNALQVAAAAKAVKRRHGLDILVVDYLGLLGGFPGTVGRREDLSLAKSSITFKNLAKELDVTVVGIQQLNREVEKRTDKRPRMSDIRESGQLEQDADIPSCSCIGMSITTRTPPRSRAPLRSSSRSSATGALGSRSTWAGQGSARGSTTSTQDHPRKRRDWTTCARWQAPVPDSDTIRAWLRAGRVVECDRGPAEAPRRRWAHPSPRNARRINPRPTERHL